MVKHPFSLHLTRSLRPDARAVGLVVMLSSVIAETIVVFVTWRTTYYTFSLAVGGAKLSTLILRDGAPRVLLFTCAAR